jgi:hypothetical protein
VTSTPRLAAVGRVIVLALAAWLGGVAVVVLWTALKASPGLGGREAILVIAILVAVCALAELRLAWTSVHRGSGALFTAAIVAFVAGVFLVLVTSGYSVIGPLTIAGACAAAVIGVVWRRSSRRNQRS